jgi:hypothetical protein
MSEHSKDSTAIDTKAREATDTPAAEWLLWGAEAIGAEIGRSASQIHYLHESRQLGDATFKLGHKTLVGDRRKLRNLQAYAIPEET